MRDLLFRQIHQIAGLFILIIRKFESYNTISIFNTFIEQAFLDIILICFFCRYYKIAKLNLAKYTLVDLCFSPNIYIL